MLRHVMGDSSFFHALRSYVREFSYGTVVTEDFQRVCEREYGRPLAWFFNEWVYGTGQPEYRLDWASAAQDGDSVTLVTVGQSSSGRSFIMPLDLRISRPGGDTTVVVWDSLPTQRWELRLGRGATDVALDPDRWVLRGTGGAPQQAPSRFFLPHARPRHLGMQRAEVLVCPRRRKGRGVALVR